MSDEFIAFRRITRTFAGVTALDDVSLTISRGECHGLMGENGAGKSTLGKVLAGIHRPDQGEIVIGGKTHVFRSPREAQSVGIGMVHQELAFCPDLSVAENLCLGHYPRKCGFVSRAGMYKTARTALSRIGVDTIDVRSAIRDLSTAQEQLVQIAATVGIGAEVLLFDEPTSSLSEPEAQRLFTLIEKLKSRGVTIIYVSHRMPEVFRLCDRFSVLRDGKYVGTIDRAGATEDDVVRMMVGRSVAAHRSRHVEGKPGEVRLRVRNLTSPGNFENVSFEIRSGEIVGFAGLVGAGRSEVARAVFGLDSQVRGEIFVAGKPLKMRNIKAAMQAGIGMLPEDRKRQGLVLMMGARQNFSLAMLERLRKFLFLNKSRERHGAAEHFARLRVKTPSLDTPVAGLSGGNQQKVALAKWLGRDASVLIVDEPTRGVDVGAKAAIHEILDNLARQGTAIMLISSELPEVIGLSTRVLVMREGQLKGELPRTQATQDAVMRLMAGVA